MDFISGARPHVQAVSVRFDKSAVKRLLKLKKAGDHAHCGVSGNCQKGKRWNGWEETVSLSWWSFWYFSSFAPRYWFLIAPIFPMLQLMDQSVWLVFSDQPGVPPIYHPTMLCSDQTTMKLRGWQAFALMKYIDVEQWCCTLWPLRWWCTLML